MRYLQRLRQLHDTVDKNLARIAGIIVIIMMALTMCDITARHVLVRPISGTYEIMRLMLAVVVFFPFAYVQMLRLQIVITIVANRLPYRLQEIFNLIWILVALFGFVILGWQGTVGTLEAIETHDVTIGLIPVPTAPARGVIAFGCMMLTIRLLRQIGEGIHRLVTGAETNKEEP